MIFVITILLCVSLFAAGNLAGKFSREILKTGESSRIALIFGLGMNNNVVGLALASITLYDHSLIMLPIIIYNLLQHIIAGIVDKRINKD